MGTPEPGGRKRRLIADAHPTLRPLLERVRLNTYVEIDENGTARVDKPVTAEALHHHLNGGPACVTYPMAPGSTTTRVATLDHDSHHGETPWDEMVRVASLVRAKVIEKGMHPTWFRSSGGRGIHTELVWDEPQDSRSVQAFLCDILTELGLTEGTGGVSKKQIEVFPKQDSLTEKGEGSFGSPFALPLAFKSVPLDEEGNPQPRDTPVAWVASPDVPLAPDEAPREPVNDVTTDLKVLKSALDAIPNDGTEPSLDYDTWLRFVFALHHDSKGSKEGLALAEEFSVRSPKHKDMKELRKQWKFANLKRHTMVTGRSIMKWARDNHGWRQTLPPEAEFEELPNDDVDDGLEDTVEEEKPKKFAWRLPAIVSDDVWLSANLAPRCIVEKYLYADVACLVAPGGTGKTTMALHEAICIALGKPVWGLRIVNPGPVLVITAEDQAERLIARMRHICAHMGLSNDETRKVRNYVRIDDCTARPWRLTEIVADVVQPSEIAYHIADGCERLKYPPALIQFDPMISFGVGESRINDAEHALITAARMLVSRLNCCVRYVHHTGKAVALEKRTDQYSGRGGSALSDGARMMAVMQPQTAQEWQHTTGETLNEGESAFVLARSKLSYAAPQPPIYIKRQTYEFHVQEALIAQSSVELLNSDAEVVLKLVTEEASFDRKHSAFGLENIMPNNMTRGRLRAAVTALLDSGRLKTRKFNAKNGSRVYLFAVPDGGGPT